MLRYTRIISRLNPEQRKVLYKHVQAKLKKQIKEDYDRPEKIKKNILKKLDKFANAKVVSRRVFKKESQGAVVFSQNVPTHSKHFKEEVERARWV